MRTSVRPVLWFAAIMCALIAVIFGVITYAPRMGPIDRAIHVGFACLSILLTLAAVLWHRKESSRLPHIVPWLGAALLVAANLVQLVPALIPSSPAPEIAVLRALYTPTKSKDEYGRVFGAIAARLHANPAALDASLEYLAKGDHSEEDTGFAGILVCALWDTLLWDGDQRRLKAFLLTIPISVNGPDGVYIEFDLVNPYIPRQIDNFAMLFEAYDHAASASVRQYLAAAVRRAYRAEIVSGMTDDQVMRQYRETFTRTKQDIKANLEYVDAYPNLEMNITNWQPMPLFIPKSGPDRVPGRTLDRRKP